MPSTQSKLPVYLVIDGIISKSSLNEINKDRKWLFENLNIKKLKELKNIILASYNEETQKIDITYKN